MLELKIKKRYLNFIWVIGVIIIIASCNDTDNNFETKKYNQNNVDTGNISFNNKQEQDDGGRIDFYCEEDYINKIDLKVNRKIETIKIHTWFNKGAYDDFISDLKKIQKNKNKKLINQKLSYLLSIDKYIINCDEGIEGNGKEIILKFLLENGADISIISLNKAFPRMSYLFLNTIIYPIPIIAILLRWGAKVNIKYSIKVEELDFKYKNLDFEEGLKTKMKSVIKRRKEKTEADKEKPERLKKSKETFNVISDKVKIEGQHRTNLEKIHDLLMNTPNPLDKTKYKINNEDLTKSDQEILNDYMKDYLTKICLELMKEEQKEKLDSNFIALLQKYRIDLEIINKLKNRL